MNGSRPWRLFGGLALVVLGGLLLLAAFGAFSFGTAWAIFFALVFIFLGLMIAFSRSYHHEHRDSLGRTVGDIRIGDTEFELHDMDTSLAAGQLRLDLTKARISAGETKVSIKGGMGRVEVIVSSGLAVAVQTEVGAGAIAIFGQKADGVGRQLTFKSPGYDGSEKRVRLEISLMVGEAIVRSSG